MRRYGAIGAIALLVFAVAGVLGFVTRTPAPSGHPSTTTSQTGTSSPQPPAKATVATPRTVLILGIDKRPYQGLDQTRSDVMIVVHTDPKNGQLTMLSVPRDTRVTLPGHGIQKINAAFTFGGPDLAVKTVEKLLGIKIDAYAYTNFPGFVSIMNALGGVTVDVPENMYYKASDVTINLKKGVQHLNGTQILEIVRYRELKFGDISREVDQQMVLHALFKQVDSLGTVLRLPVLVPAFYRNVTTDMSLTQLFNLARSIHGSAHKMVNAVLPGAFLNLPGDSQWYVIPADAQQAWKNLLAGKKPSGLFDQKAVHEAATIAAQAKAAQKSAAKTPTKGTTSTTTGQTGTATAGK